MHELVQIIVFRGVDTIPLKFQVHIVSGLTTIAIVSLADKAVAEFCERVWVVLSSIGLALLPKRIVVNLAPADVVKVGTHFYLPVTLDLLIAIGVMPHDAISDRGVLGQLAQ